MLIAALIAAGGLMVAASAAFGWWHGTDRYRCAHTVRGCVYVEPDTQITAGPPAFTNNRHPSFSFSSSQGRGTFMCELDGEPLGHCPSGFSVGPLGDGPHTFSVAKRSSGHVLDTTPATRAFTVDTHPPNTNVTGGPSGLTNDDTPTFTFDAPGEVGETFQCKVDAAAYAPCTSGHPLSHLNDGNHTFFVRAVDRAHNVDPTPATRTIKVDTTPPSTAITGGPSGVTGDSTPTFSFSSTEPGSSFQCKVDGAAFGPCSSPKTTSPLGDGAHAFAVRAIDAAGNVDASPATRAFTVDTGPPNTTITGGPSGSTTDNTPTFTFRSTKPGSFQCKVDGAPFTGCSSPKTTAPLSVGGHTFAVRAIDTLGHVDPSPATRSFNVKRR